MAQKPNFLKRLIKTISTAAFIAAASSSAMGAGVQKTVNVPTASFGTGTDWLPAVAVGNGDSLLYSATGNTIIGNVNNTVTINNNGINSILQIGTATAGNTVGVAGVVGSKQLTIMMMNEASNLILGPNGVTAGNFAVAGEVGSYVGLLNINFSNTNSNVSIETDGFTSDVTFISSGGVNGTITLNAKGVTLNGNITNLKAIDLNSNNLTFGGNNIQLLANGSAITFRANEQLTLTSAADIEINSNIVVTNDQQGSIDASGLASGQGLVIKGDIGNYSTSVRLGQFNIGSSATDFNAGNAAIDNLIFGNDGIALFAHNNYLITKTTNASGQGTIIFRPVVADNTNLVAGTNLGSADNPLAEINFAAPAGTNTDTILNVGQGVNLYATEITTAGVNTGSFNFNGGGTSIVSGTVGTDANKFNSITLTNNTTVKFTDDVISNGTTTIGGNSTLQIANDYIADSIQGNAAGDTGTLQFVNTKGILVALKGNPNPDNALAALQVSGSADVAINGIVNVNGEISLGVNVLGFTDGTSTWGNDTTISTTLTSDEVMGNIVISGAAEVKVAGLKTIKVQDNASIDFIGTRAYTLIQGKISAVNDDIDPNVVGTNRYVIYGLIDNNETLVTRTIDIDNIENILNNDISGNGNPVIRHNLVTFLNTNNTGNAEQAYNNILLAQNTNDAATSFAATLTDTSTSVNNININVAKEEQGLIGYRLDELRYLCTPESDKMASSEGGVAAGDEPIDNVAYGVYHIFCVSCKATEKEILLKYN